MLVLTNGERAIHARVLRLSLLVLSRVFRNGPTSKTIRHTCHFIIHPILRNACIFPVQCLPHHAIHYPSSFCMSSTHGQHLVPNNSLRTHPIQSTTTAKEARCEVGTIKLGDVQDSSRFENRKHMDR
jgi:hypothetical protein